MNEVRLSAQVIERAAMRWTPAGLPALDLKLSHTSQVMQMGQPRRISMDVHATAFGDLARDMERLALGTSILAIGFLAKSRNGRGLMLLIDRFERVASDPVSNVPDSF